MTYSTLIDSMKKLITLLIFIGINFGAIAQHIQVENTAYQLLLKTLLSHSVPEMSVNELTKKNNTVLLLDAREPKEYQISHLKDAKLVGYEKLDLSYLKNTPKNQPIVVYCSVGYRSEKVAEKLLQQGFTNVHNLYGGIFEWKNQNQVLVNEKGITDEVHAYDKTWGIWLKKGKKVYK